MRRAWTLWSAYLTCGLMFALTLGLVTGCPPSAPPGNGNTNGNSNGNSNNNSNGNDNTSDDDDGDGVVNADDECPDTPADVEVDENGCADTQRDADDDGISDALDQCPDTPADVTVGNDGCPITDDDLDNDGVPNNVDDCPGTPSRVPVDAVGCSAAQRDTDGDGVNDADDDCPRTPPGAQVDANGCRISAGGPDSDGDGVNDDVDDCPDTPDGATVDATGCAAAQLDSDDDGVNDDADLCGNTAAGATVNAQGCSPAQLDSDSDGVNDAADQCPDTPAGTAVNATGCPTGGGGGGGGGGTTTVCGNGVVETGEACEPPGSSTCDANCQSTTGGALANNACTSPTAIGEGTRQYSNVGATTDGPADCTFFGNAQTDSDIWYCYTATCSEQVTVSLCGSQYDTKLVVYNGCTCPDSPQDVIACSDDNCGQGNESRLTFAAVSGQQYLVRVGGFLGDQNNDMGAGTLTIYCASDPDRGANACVGGTGDCFTGHVNPGCETPAVCTATCTADPFCCDTTWDDLCGEKADGITNGFGTCSANSGACEVGRPTPGCNNVTCCQSVCEADPFCCLTQWDDVCASAIGPTCGLFPACGTGGSCFSSHAAPGCNNAACCALVCAADGACCSDTWDDICVGSAQNLCR